MNNRDIIRSLRKSGSRTRLWTTMARYFQILDNYLDGKTLSVVEPKNHKDCEPRKYYLELLAKGFGIEIDYSSPLWEGRLDQTRHSLYWTDDSSFYGRFFRRLEFFKKENHPINPQTLVEMVTQGSALFNPTYKYYLDPH